MRWRNGSQVTAEAAKAMVPKGWAGLIDRLFADLEGWDGEVWQIKEKFGGLRFYVASADELVSQRIEEAEQEAITSCHECGSPGATVAPNGWVRVLCEDHGGPQEPHA